MKSLRFNNISFGYNKNNPIFKDLSFEIGGHGKNAGHVAALMGASGSGKSSMFKLILQTEKLQSGKIDFSIENPVIAYLPQEPVLFEHLSPTQNARYFQRSEFYKKKFDESLYQELVVSLNMQDVLGNAKSVLELSGGQRQKISLLKSLSIRPDLLMLDEPTTGLDAEVKLQFLNKLREIVTKYNLLVIYITHHKLETELIADEIIYLSKNNSSESFSKLYQDDIVSFIQQPPLLEALKVFTYPKPNILRGKLESGLFIPTDDITGTDYFYLGLAEDNISFSEMGLPFNVIASNPINTIIKFENTNQLININTNKIPVNSLGKMLIEGTFNLYDLNGCFSKKIIIKN
jgi:ABC-type multidrug transport system ATPase subunit